MSSFHSSGDTDPCSSPARCRLRKLRAASGPPCRRQRASPDSASWVQTPPMFVLARMDKFEWPRQSAFVCLVQKLGKAAALCARGISLWVAVPGQAGGWGSASPVGVESAPARTCARRPRPARGRVFDPLGSCTSMDGTGRLPPTAMVAILGRADTIQLAALLSAASAGELCLV